MHRRAGDVLTDARPAPEAMLEALWSRRARSALIVDFDGSVAPIVDDPVAAVADPAVVGALEHAVAQFAVVAVVSGRPAAFLAERLPVPGLVLAGHYGLETAVDRTVTLDARVELFRDAIATAAAELDAAFPDLYVERKGEVAVALHWRRAPEREEAAHARVAALGAHLGLEVFPGRRVAELRPAIPVDKGTVVDTLVDGLDGALFAGDDEADLAAFDALARRVDDGTLRFAVRVAVRSREAPPRLLADADLVVDGPPGLAALVGALSADRRPRGEAALGATRPGDGSPPRRATPGSEFGGR